MSDQGGIMEVTFTQPFTYQQIHRLVGEQTGLELWADPETEREKRLQAALWRMHLFIQTGEDRGADARPAFHEP